jgi:signal transduction histidine kinase
MIFERFYRGKDDPAAGRPGTGLGLYIARTLVEAMSGRIWVDSEIGIDTTFSFSLQTVDADHVADLRFADDLPAAPDSLLDLVPSR